MGTPPNDVISAVSEEAACTLDIPIHELPPLSDVLDPDALDNLLASTASFQSPGITVSFRYAGLDVFIHSQEVICVQPVCTNTV
jgi:hypothetical protein